MDRLFVENIPKQSKVKDLFDVLKTVKGFVDCKIIRERKYDKYGQIFLKGGDADNLIKNSQISINGNILKFSKNGEPIKPTKSPFIVCINDVDKNETRDVLRQLLNYGIITKYIYDVRDNHTGFVIVTFDSLFDRNILHTKIYCKNKIYIIKPFISRKRQFNNDKLYAKGYKHGEYVGYIRGINDGIEMKLRDNNK